MRLLQAVVLAAVAAVAAAAVAPGTELMWVEQPVDHFGYGGLVAGRSFQQRVFFNDSTWGGVGYPVFFYCGNEADVTLYVNHTGLMWENAAAFRALLVFAEHRYYGESLPFGPNGSFTPQGLQWLTHEQALADYAALLTSMKSTGLTIRDSPVVAFGGSYGGMLAAWFRIKYPHIISGSIAASAPILGFPGMSRMMDPPADSQKYWGVVSSNADADCQQTARVAFSRLFEEAKYEQGLHLIGDAMNLCKPMSSEMDAYWAAIDVMMSFDTLAMGNYPYPSNYLTNGEAVLPAHPFTAACDALKNKAKLGLNSSYSLIQGLAAASNVYKDPAGVSKCYSLPLDRSYDGIWDYQWCTQLMCQESYFSRDSVNDMFPKHTLNLTEVVENCRTKYNVTTAVFHMAEQYPGSPEALAAAGISNIVFSNGALDPWHAFGVLYNVTDDITVVMLPNGAHHNDLFFSNEMDPPDFVDARKIELEMIRKWTA